MDIVRNAMLPGMAPVSERIEWPFKDMNVGDVVEIPNGLKTATRRYVHVYGRGSGKRFAVRTVEGVMRVYRIG